MILLAPLVGYIADVFSFTAVLFIEGIVVLLFGIPLVFIINKANHKHTPTQYL